MLYRLSAVINRGFNSYYQARKNGQIHVWLIALIAIYTPFEDLIVAWLPLPGTVQTGLRFIPELTIYLIFIQVVSSRFVGGKSWQTTVIDPLILALAIATTISVLLNHSRLFPSLAKS